MTFSVNWSLGVALFFSSTLINSCPPNSSKTCSSRGKGSPANFSAKLEPASRFLSWSHFISFTLPCPSVVRLTFRSWITTKRSSAESITSSSIPSAPSSLARRKEAIVFSGAKAEAPRCAMIRGWFWLTSLFMLNIIACRAFSSPINCHFFAGFITSTEVDGRMEEVHFRPNVNSQAYML